MKASKAENKKLLAVIGTGKVGIFFRHIDPVNSVFVDWEGKASFEKMSLEDILDATSERTPVYEGDLVTLQF